MTKLEFTRSDEKATAILKAVRLIDEGAELAPVVHGRWIYGRDLRCCSLCGSEMGTRDGWSYCPNCGAKMDGGTNGKT